MSCSPIRMQAKSGCILAMLAWSGCVFAQASPAPESVRQYVEFIEREEDANGLTSPALIEAHTALGQQYMARQDYELAVDAFKKARQITRVNDGFNTLQELPVLAHLVRAEDANGNFAEAWRLEQDLLNLAQRHAGKLETLPVLLELAQKRVNVWERYRTGGYPPQIVLGCYYNRGSYVAYAGMIPAHLASAADSGTNCTAGLQRTVSLALLLEARSYQMLAMEALLQNDRYASDELQLLLTEILRLSHTLYAGGLGAADPLLGQMMARLLSWVPQDSASRVRRAQVLLLLADMNAVRLAEYRSNSGFDILRDQYVHAYRMLQNENVGQAYLDEIFAPPLPVVLPSFARNPLAGVAQSDADGYIDVAFEITDKGRSRRIKIMDTGGRVERADQRALRRLIARSGFRPRLADGQVLASAPVVVRYYLRASP